MIVRESINFERGINPKTALGVGTYIPGRLFKWHYRPEFPNVYMFVEIFEKKWRLYFYIGRFINPKNSLFGSEFSFSEKFDSDNSWNLQKIGDDKFVPISPGEEEKIKKILLDPEYENFWNRLEKFSKGIRPILKESVNFQRGLSDREIKDVLVGWREGQFVINPYTNIVYVFLREWEGKNDIELFSLGHLRNIGSVKRSFFQKYKKKTDFDWARTTFKTKDKLRTLNPEEWHFVKPSITPEYINKVKENFGVKVIV